MKKHKQQELKKKLTCADVFALIESYGKDKSVPLKVVLNAIVDFEQEKRK